MYEKKYRTLTKKFGKYKVKATQDGYVEHSGGHYIIILEDNKGNILDVINSTAGVPSEDITSKDLIYTWKSHWEHRFK